MFNIILKITILNFFFFFSNVYTKISFANIVIISYENYNEEDFNLGSIKEHIKILTKKSPTLINPIIKSPAHNIPAAILLNFKESILSPDLSKKNELLFFYI